MATLSSRAADALRATLPDLANDIIAAIAAEVPDYSGAMEGRFAQGVRFGVEVALSRFVDVLAGEPPDRGPARTPTSGSAPASTAPAARSTRCWPPTASARGSRGGGSSRRARRPASPPTSSTTSARRSSPTSTRSRPRAPRASRRRSRRRRASPSAAAGTSCACSCRSRPRPRRACALAAQAAGWTLPRRVAAVVAGEAEAPEREDEIDAAAVRLARRIGPGAVGAAVAGVAVVLLPDPEGPGRRKTLETASDGRHAALGPAVAWPEVATSLRRAAAAYRLSVQGRLSPTGQSLVVADDHLPALLLAAEPALAADLARSRLAPLDTLGPGPRERLAATLRAWLDRPGQVQAVAAELDVHPQTVRYRLKQLRELFGARLEDPEARFELALALRAADGIRYT